ncbi:hypothetical protein [Bradyrhizobium sp. Ghvi]|uniref:hypothetical protein n=1 Tax=Bradyrhizobium sp. Ghvi TaxID=1855319 RepID=UPI0015A56367|nr:hypothetical protein [Bradyrhizobium sp. Ghvi]
MARTLTRLAATNGYQRGHFAVSWFKRYQVGGVVGDAEHGIEYGKKYGKAG